MFAVGTSTVPAVIASSESGKQWFWRVPPEINPAYCWVLEAPPKQNLIKYSYVCRFGSRNQTSDEVGACCLQTPGKNLFLSDLLSFNCKKKNAHALSFSHLYNIITFCFVAWRIDAYAYPAAMLLYLLKPIKYSTGPYLCRFVQWCLSVTVFTLCIFILQSLTCQSNHLLISLWRLPLQPYANRLAANPMLFCSIGQLNGCVLQPSWTNPCPILPLGLRSISELALRHLEPRCWCPVDDNHSKWWWPSYSLRTYAHGPKCCCQYTQAFAPFLQFVVIANLSPSFAFPFFSLLLSPEHQKQKGETFSQWLATLSRASPARSLAFFSSPLRRFFGLLPSCRQMVCSIPFPSIWFCCSAAGGVLKACGF